MRRKHYHYEEKIFSYLNQFKTLFPGEPLTAKFHFMIHYGRSIREFGPVVQYSTMRFESKHSHFKQIDRAVHNQINLTKSITTKHQELQLFYLSSQNYFNSSEYGSNDTVSPVNLNILKNLLDSDDIMVLKWTIHDNI